jgi:RHS repeat-associated protein
LLPNLSFGVRARFAYNLRFPGQYYQAETALNQNYHRDYDALVGRYVESDPMGLRGGINTYGYVEENPLLAVDPSGRLPAFLQGWPFALHGNWCGPNWTGGFVAEFNELTAAERRDVEPPIDPVDAACEKHDKCYGRCRDGHPCSPNERLVCFSQCDLNLVSSVYSQGFWGYVVGSIIGGRQPDVGNNAPGCPQCGNKQ